MMLKKLLASVGIGSAKVDLEIPNPQVELGGILEGVVKIKGGSVEQEIEKIYINLVLNSKYGSGDETKPVSRTVGTVKVTDKLTLAPGQEKTIPVNFEIPLDIPISKGRTRYYLKTGLDIEQALDPTDLDDIKILPNKYMKMLFDAVSALGFREKHNSGDYNGRYQEFEYRPTSFMARELDEIELYPTAGEQELNVVIQIDKRNRGLFGSLLDDLDLDERYVRIRIPYSQMNDVTQVANFLRETIESEYRKIL
ncbi:sporulation protein [Thermincola potens]|nr:sporulation protein [Thermincola potens]